jgi:cysteine desulfurase
VAVAAEWSRHKGRRHNFQEKQASGQCLEANLLKRNPWKRTSMRERIYLDYNASAPLLPVARDAMLAMLDLPGNASSVHREGQAQKRAIEAARRAVAALVNAKPDRVVFTSGATEAAAMLLSPDWTIGRAPWRFHRLLVSAIEHPCIAAGGRFQPEQLMQLPVTPNGLLDFAALEMALENCRGTEIRPLVAVQLANNETGVIQDINAIAEHVHNAGGMLIVDAAQAAGRLPVDLATLGADAIILSAHKMGGPKGAGAIVFAGDIARPRPLLNGGGQEKGFRAGTENAAALAGFGAAALEAARLLNDRSAILALRDRFIAGLHELAPEAVVHGEAVSRLDNTAFFSLPDIKAETAMIGFDLAGIAVSSGSACSSGKVGRSAVLEAMGYPLPNGAIRVSFGPHNDAEHVAIALATLKKLLARSKPVADG